MTPLDKIKQQRQRINVYHNYFKRSGFYRFIGQNLIKLVVSLLIFALLFYLVKKYLIDFNLVFDYLFNNLNTVIVFVIFFISEIFLGLLPPDLFIAWTHSCNMPWFGVTILAISSYIGGLLAYKLGFYIRLIPRVNKFVERKFKNNFELINKYGAVIIVFAALFPLPYSPVILISGILKYPFKTVVWLAIFRIIRFFAYAFFIYWGLEMKV
jgi:membrane protein YqaA with SNARE-associated domain